MIVVVEVVVVVFATAAASAPVVVEVVVVRVVIIVVACSHLAFMCGAWLYIPVMFWWLFIYAVSVNPFETRYDILY